MTFDASDSSHGVTVRQVTAVDVRELRRSVLRANMANKVVDFDGDEDEQTIHLAAFDESETMIGTSTWIRRGCLYVPNAAAIQLRGMATAVSCQGHGVGSLLLQAGFNLWRQQAVDVIWANARDAALKFYERHGFIVHGDGFIEAVTQLPHHVVIRTLDLS